MTTNLPSPTWDFSNVPLVELSLRLLRTVARGPCSSVHEVEARSGERFALKLLEHGVADDESFQRFERERRVLASLRHPALPQIVASGRTHDGKPYILLPWIDGESLARRLQHGPLGVTTTVRVLRDVLGALAVAHDAGVVHRDVKPSNVLLPRRGEASGGAVLVDFGAAYRRGDLDLTTEGWVIGTPRWLAPEQLLGGRVDARTDVYAAGLVLFEALVGEHPFARVSDVDVVAAHLELPVPPLPSAFPRVLARVVAIATRKVPSERYASARAMARALESLAPGGGACPSREPAPRAHAEVRP